MQETTENDHVTPWDSLSFASHTTRGTLKNLDSAC